VSFFRPTRVILLAAVTLVVSNAQDPRDLKITRPSRRDKAVKSGHWKSVRDLDQLMTLASELKAELEKTSCHVLSVSSVRRSEEIEDLAKKIRSRLRNP
jgi:undecaprenyl pyrophosphate synthase